MVIERELRNAERFISQVLVVKGQHLLILVEAPFLQIGNAVVMADYGDAIVVMLVKGQVVVSLLVEELMVAISMTEAPVVRILLIIVTVG